MADSNEQLVSATIFSRTVVGTARTAGVAASDLVARLGVDEAKFDDPEAWFPAVVVERFLELVGERLGHSAPGLWVGENVSVDAGDLLGYAMRTADTLGGAYETAARYYDLVGTQIEVYYHEDVEHGLFTHGVAPRLASGRRHRDELIAATMTTLGRAITGTNWTPARVTFQHARPTDVQVHRELFGRDPEFDEPATEIAIQRDVAALPSAMADGALHEILERYASSLVTPGLGQPPLLRTLRLAIMHALPGGDLSVENMARSVHFSARTLQRRLSEHDTTYAEFLRQTRRYLAEGYLYGSAVSIDEVAFLLGYANTPAFSRAFKQWTGVSPGIFRQRARGATG